MDLPGASLRGEARLEWGLVLAGAGLGWDTSPRPPLLGQERMPWGGKAGPGGLCQQPWEDQLCGRVCLGLQRAVAGSGAPWLRQHLSGCAEKLDEILAAAAEPALRPDIADADSRAATVKQRPTSRRITPAEISVSPPELGAGPWAGHGATGPRPLPPLVHVEGEGPSFGLHSSGVGVKDPKASSEDAGGHLSSPNSHS